MSEVEREQRLSIERNTFDEGRDLYKKANKQYFTGNEGEVSTAAGLLSTNLIHENKCTFCEKKKLSRL